LIRCDQCPRVFISPLERRADNAVARDQSQLRHGARTEPPGTIVPRKRFHDIPAQMRTDIIMRAAMLGTILLVVLILLLVGAIPSWPHSRSWGYGPSGLLGVVLVVVLILALTGRV
jgi:hypothetical protein